MSENTSVGKVFNLTGGGAMQVSVYDPSRRKTDVFAYADQQIKMAMDSAFHRFYENLLTDQAIYHALYDSNGDSILDSSERGVESRIVFVMK